ncbi:hypothetical protein LOZ66_000624 [Ophidiomyces ophidiicola]|nr:hypothetical protein LOZ66_000624 [Ophidiomyces ophidiicola]
MKRILNFRRHSTLKEYSTTKEIPRIEPNRSFSVIDTSTRDRPGSPVIERPYLDPLTSLYLRNSCSLLVENVRSRKFPSQPAPPAKNTTSNPPEQPLPEPASPPAYSALPTDTLPMAPEKASIQQPNRLATLTEEPAVCKGEEHGSTIPMPPTSIIPERKNTIKRPRTSNALNTETQAPRNDFFLVKSKSTSNLKFRSERSVKKAASQNAILGHKAANEGSLEDPETLSKEPLITFRECLERQFAMDTSIRIDFNEANIVSSAHELPMDNETCSPSPSTCQPLSEPNLSGSTLVKPETHSTSELKRQTTQSLPKRFAAHFSWRKYQRH